MSEVVYHLRSDPTRDTTKLHQRAYLLNEFGPEIFSEASLQKVAKTELKATYPSSATISPESRQTLVLAGAHLLKFKNTGEEEYLESARNLFQSLTDEASPVVRFIALMGLARVSSTEKKLDQAIEYANEARTVLEETEKYRTEFCQLYSFLGDQYYKQIESDPLYEHSSRKLLSEYDEEFSGRKAEQMFLQANKFPLAISSFRLGKLYWKMNQRDDAMSIWKNAVDKWEVDHATNVTESLQLTIGTPMAEDLAHLFIRVASIYSRGKMEDLALMYLDRAIMVFPHESWAYAEKANTLSFQRNNEEAEKYANMAIERNPDDKLALITLARCAFYSRRREEARNKFDELIAKYPDDRQLKKTKERLFERHQVSQSTRGGGYRGRGNTGRY